MFDAFKIEAEHNLKEAIYQNKNNEKFGLEDTLYKFEDRLIEPFIFEYLSFYAPILLDPKNINEMEFKSYYKYKPSFVSEEIYKTPKLEHMILYANVLFHPEEFINKNLNGKIKYIKPSVLHEVLLDIDSLELQVNERDKIINMRREDINE